MGGKGIRKAGNVLCVQRFTTKTEVYPIFIFEHTPHSGHYICGLCSKPVMVREDGKKKFNVKRTLEGNLILFAHWEKAMLQEVTRCSPSPTERNQKGMGLSSAIRY